MADGSPAYFSAAGVLLFSARLLVSQRQWSEPLRSVHSSPRHSWIEVRLLDRYLAVGGLQLLSLTQTNPESDQRDLRKLTQFSLNLVAKAEPLPC